MTAASFINSAMGAKIDQIDTGSNTGLSTILPFRPGWVESGDQMSDFVYVTASSAFSTGTTVADGQFVYFDKTFSATLLLQTTHRGKIGDFVGAIRFAGSIAQNNGFWVQILGQCNVSCSVATAANTQLKTTASAGLLTATTSGGNNSQLAGVIIHTATGGAAVTEGRLNYPFITADL